MSFEQRLKLMSLYDLHQGSEDLATGFHVLHCLDAICANPWIDWTSVALFNEFRRCCSEEVSELIVHSMAIAMQYRYGHRLNITPLLEAGYKMQYVVRDGKLVDLLWTTPKGIIRLEYKNDGIRRLK